MLEKIEKIKREKETFKVLFIIPKWNKQHVNLEKIQKINRLDTHSTTYYEMNDQFVTNNNNNI